MSYARAAAILVNAYAVEAFGNVKHATKVLRGDMLDAFDHKGYSSYKHAPVERLEEDLCLDHDSGIYGFITMSDDSLLLLTCSGELAHWDGGETRASWVLRE